MLWKILFLTSFVLQVESQCNGGSVFCEHENQCMPSRYVCDGLKHCRNGEDESYDHTGLSRCCPQRNENAARLVNRICRPACGGPGAYCKFPRTCVCDHECGFSCVSTENICSDPPTIDNQATVTVKRRKNNEITPTTKPYKFQDYAFYTCKPGYKLEPDVPRRCSARKTWTQHTKCVATCAARQYSTSCARECKSNLECEGITECACDGPCGRSCVQPLIRCGDPPDSQNARFETSGTGRGQTAKYSCLSGTYASEGDRVLHCVGNGHWFGTPLRCNSIVCGNPLTSIYLTGGFYTGRYKGDQVGDSITFSCPSTHRMLGSETRTCLPTGQWSGILTVCDRIFRQGSNENVCAHPGIPINGALRGDNFVVGSTVRFMCLRGYVLLGEEEQTCLWTLEWTGGGAPICHNINYLYTPPNFMASLRMVEDTGGPTGKSINAYSTNKQEIYFLVHYNSFDDGTFSDKITLVEMIVKELDALIKKAQYGIVMTGSKSDTIVDVNEDDDVDTPTIISKLDDFFDTRGEGVNSELEDVGTALQRLVQNQITPSALNNLNERVERHVFLIIDGSEAIDDLTSVQENVEATFNPIQFYGILFQKDGTSEDTMNNVKKFAKRPENLLVTDGIAMRDLISKIFADKPDYSSCGISGVVSNLKRRLARTIGKTIGGERATSNAWPWHAVISHKPDSRRVIDMYNSPNLKGGGSLINKKWVLTAAHVFGGIKSGFDDLEYYVTLGIAKRPKSGPKLDKNARIFKIVQGIIHENYRGNNDYDYDFALVKLGGEMSPDDDRIYFVNELKQAELEFGEFIRPICLPCSENSCLEDVLTKKNKHGNILIRTGQSDQEKCNIQKEYLYQLSKTGALVSGFGHNKTTDGFLNPSELSLSRNLHQVLLKVEDHEECRDNIGRIHRVVGDSDKSSYKYTDRMLCARGNDKYDVQDTCTGDSGGPMISEVLNPATGKTCWVQIGVVSYGYGCGQTYRGDDGRRIMYPGYYSNVLNQIDWINNKLGGDKCNPPCHAYAECSQRTGFFACMCRSGFIGDGQNCIDIDECSRGIATCDGAGARCVNTPGSYECECDGGYVTTNAGDCEDINECSEDNDCSPNAQCINTVGSYTCRCNALYQGDGRTCTRACGTRGPSVPKNSAKGFASNDEFPWAVYINSKASKTNLCNGNIITSNYVLSSSNCVSNNASAVRVWFGVHEDASKLQAIIGKEVSSVTTSPANSPGLVLLRLRTPLVLSNSVQPICLPENDQDFNQITRLPAGGEYIGWSIQVSGSCLKDFNYIAHTTPRNSTSSEWNVLPGGVVIQPKLGGAANTRRYMASQVLTMSFNPTQCSDDSQNIILTRAHVNWIKTTVGMQ